MSSLLRVRVSSFLAGVAVAGTAALIWLRDDVRHSFETLHTHTEGFSTTLDRRVRLLEDRVAALEDSKGARP